MTQIVLALLVATTALSAQEPPAAKRNDGKNASGGKILPEQAAYDVLHYDLALSVFPEKREIEGTVTVTARILSPIRYLILDLDDPLRVKKASSGDRGLSFQQKNGMISIDLGAKAEKDQVIKVAVRYGGKPRLAPNAPWDGGVTWKKTPSGAHWIATTCQGEGADLWWPCKDHPSDKSEAMDIRITIPEELFCASNGKLKSNQKNGDGTRTVHWRLDTPIGNYNVALNIAPYTMITEEFTSVTGEKVPVAFYVLPESVQKAKKALPYFLKDLAFFEKICGPFPFRSEKYGVVETPHLGMEHQTIIAYGNKFRAAPGGYDWLHNHELSHEWWGNLVSCRDWKDMWIHEGIGTYMQALYLEDAFGKDRYHKEMRKTRFGIRNRKAVAPRELQDSKEIYFGSGGNDIYNKGSWIMHTLRWFLGDKKFFEALKRMAYPDPAMEKVTDGSQVRFTDTEEIRAIAEKSSGEKLDWFFEVYLRQPKLPKIVVDREGTKVTIHWNVPDDLPFPMPVEVQIGEKTERMNLPATITVPEGTDVEVDPKRWILRR
jgi:aminopeptidase N